MLLEGLEVVFIVITFGASQHRVEIAAAAAAVAVLLVVAIGVAVRAPLALVPENAMKFSVGVMLTSFGTFWGAEGAGASWPGGDAALLVIIPAVVALGLAMVAWLRRPTPARSHLRSETGVKRLVRHAVGSGSSSPATTRSPPLGVAVALGVTARSRPPARRLVGHGGRRGAACAVATPRRALIAILVPTHDHARPASGRRRVTRREDGGPV